MKITLTAPEIYAFIAAFTLVYESESAQAFIVSSLPHIKAQFSIPGCIIGMIAISASISKEVLFPAKMTEDIVSFPGYYKIKMRVVFAMLVIVITAPATIAGFYLYSAHWPSEGLALAAASFFSAAVAFLLLVFAWIDINEIVNGGF